MPPPGNTKLRSSGSDSFQRVDLAFQRGHVARLDDRLLRVAIRGQRRQIAAQVEELVLDARQHRGQRVRAGGRARREQRRARDADASRQLVDGAVRLDAQGVLADLLPADEPRVAAVAGLRVDAIEPDHHHLSPNHQLATYKIDKPSPRRGGER